LLSALKGVIARSSPGPARLGGFWPALSLLVFFPEITLPRFVLVACTLPAMPDKLAALTRATSRIAVDGAGGPAHYGLNQVQVVEQKGPDAAVKRVRIVPPR
jgi:hypothetical protein